MYDQPVGRILIKVPYALASDRVKCTFVNFL
jgi:hypothetical protein